MKQQPRIAAEDEEKTVAAKQPRIAGKAVNPSSLDTSSYDPYGHELLLIHY